MPLQDWAQREVLSLREVQFVFSSGTARKPQGDYCCVPDSPTSVCILSPHSFNFPLFFMFQCVENVSRQNCPVCMEVTALMGYKARRMLALFLIYFLQSLIYISLFCLCCFHAGYSHIQDWSSCSSMWPSFTQVGLLTLWILSVQGYGV